MEVYEGAEHNLPDQAAMTTAERIQTMVSEKMCTDDILLVLISGEILYTEKKVGIIFSFFTCVRRRSLSTEHRAGIF